MRGRGALAAAAMVAAAFIGPLRAQGTTEIVSVATSGAQGNDISARFSVPAISANGRIVAFDSQATTLVSGDSNHVVDVFVRDLDAGTTDRVSVSSAGVAGNGTSTRPGIDASGDLVIFDSSASNLVASDTNSVLDVFVHDRTTHTTSRVSVSSAGAQGNGASYSPMISANGRYVTFISIASNLVPNDTNGVEDAFVRDLQLGTTERVSVSSAGVPGNNSTTLTSISGDGNVVVFMSFSSNLVLNDTNGTLDLFSHDRTTGVTEFVSVDNGGVQANGTSSWPTVNGDGRYVAFWSDATNLVAGDTNNLRDAFVRDRLLGITERVSVGSNGEQGDGNVQDAGIRGFNASGPDITADGRFVTFFSTARTMVAGDTNVCGPNWQTPPGRCPDVFVRDRLSGTTTRVSVATDGTQANYWSGDPVISDDGTTVAFFSAASSLVLGDLNTCAGFSAFPGQCPDVFVHTTPAAPAGPGSVGTDLRLGKTGTPAIRLTWGPSCSALAVDYGIYEGVIGSWYSHTSLDCSDDGSNLTEDVVPGDGGRYYLVVPLAAGITEEGSYGTDSAGAPRPPGVATCAPQQNLAACP
jgi:hypothetical protein